MFSVRQTKDVYKDAVLSKEEFVEIYRQHSSTVRAVLFRLGAESQLDDLCQEVFIKVWKKYSDFKGESSLKTWITKIALNTALEALRKRASPMVPLDENMIYEKGNDGAMRQLLQKALGELSSEHRTVIILAIVEEYSSKEISVIMEVPEGTVKSRLHLARKNLAEILKKMGASYEEN